MQAGQFDIENGWSLDERNWAILTAAENTVETAEQVRYNSIIVRRYIVLPNQAFLLDVHR